MSGSPLSSSSSIHPPPADHAADHPLTCTQEPQLTNHSWLDFRSLLFVGFSCSSFRSSLVAHASLTYVFIDPSPTSQRLDELIIESPSAFESRPSPPSFSLSSRGFLASPVSRHACMTPTAVENRREWGVPIQSLARLDGSG